MSKTVIVTCSLLIIFGFLSGWDMRNQLIAGRIHLNIGVLFIPIGIGLLLGRRSARTAAVAIFWIIYLFCAAALLASLFGKATIQLTGTPLSTGSAFAFALVIVAIICSITAFFHWILYSPPFEEHLS